MTSLTPTLTTKLHPPRASRELVVRTRLLDRLDRGLDRALTLISAPAGFGKTTLVVQWLHHSSFLVPRFRTAWLSLDDDDNDPARFLAYLVAAFQTVQPDLGRAALATHVHYAAGNTAAGKQALADAYRTARTSGNVMIAVIALTHLAEADMGEGRLHQAEATYRQVLGLAVGPDGQRLPIAGLALIGLGELSREWNRLDESVRYVTVSPR